MRGRLADSGGVLGRVDLSALATGRLGTLKMAILSPRIRYRGITRRRARQCRFKSLANTGHNAPQSRRSKHRAQAGALERRAGGRGHDRKRSTSRNRKRGVVDGCAVVYA